jgi:hypothetical protein
MKILAMKKQAELSGLMDSIGKQITGWRKKLGDVDSERECRKRPVETIFSYSGKAGI